MQPTTSSPFWRRRVAQGLASALGVLLLAISIHSTPHSTPTRFAGNSLSGWPHTTVWAWERPENLQFTDARETAVAFLASTVTLRDNTATNRLRMQPLRIPANARLMAVVRVEARNAALTAEQRDATVNAVVAASALPRVTAVQIDFDATTSQRAFYRDVLNDLRARLPRTPISITALASWCMDDDWIGALPVDEAVPMLFRMGRDNLSIRARLKSGNDFREPLCRASVGLSTDEPPAMMPGGRRVYWFAPRSWTQGQLAEVSR